MSVKNTFLPEMELKDVVHKGTAILSKHMLGVATFFAEMNEH